MHRTKLSGNVLLDFFFFFFF